MEGIEGIRARRGRVFACRRYVTQNTIRAQTFLACITVILPEYYQSMYLVLVFFLLISRTIKTGDSLKSCASLFFLLSPLPPPSIYRNWTAVLKWLQKWPKGTEFFSHPFHSLYGATAPFRAVVPPQKTPPILLLVFSILVFPGSVTCPSRQRPPIFSWFSHLSCSFEISL